MSPLGEMQEASMRNSGIVRFTALAAVAYLSATPHCLAAADLTDNSTSASVFGHDLVTKVKRTAIYIWMMQGAGPFGTLVPTGIGSGVIFQAIPEENAAFALTNHHVASETALLQVETWDRQTFKAELVATEPGIDVAIIKIYNIPPDAYEVAVLGDSDKIQPGEPALAIGAPGSRDSSNTNRSDPYIDFGLHLTTTMRVVTGTSTDPFELISNWPAWRNDLGYGILTNLPKRIVTQTTINGGNSGGPLYNARGEVIGLNHAGSGGLFAKQIMQNGNITIPINYAKTFAYQILNNGEYDLPWLGLDMLIPPTFSSSQQVQEFTERWYQPDVLRVISVRKDSPGERAGLRQGDIVIEFDGKEFASIVDLRLYVFDLTIGRSIPIRVLRGREKKTLNIEVEAKRRYNSEFSM
jgi:serine protease Do